MLKVTDGGLDGLKIIELKHYEDDRGFFVERFNAKYFSEFELPTLFLQDNHSWDILNDTDIKCRINAYYVQI